MTSWDPDQYLRFSDDRSRPYVDLLNRVDVDAGTVVDLGCGPGHLTDLLLTRWPTARVIGVDASAEMVQSAKRDHPHPQVRYLHADLRTWRPDQPVDLLVSNATFQWVPGHLDLLPELADVVRPGGVLAFSVPLNHDAPSHRILRDLMAQPPFAEHLADVALPRSAEPQEYLDVLTRPGWSADVWESTYLHVLTGADPVFEWISGTGAREPLERLEGDTRELFVRTFKARLAEAYPAREYGTVLPFRRGFAVARRAA